MENIPTPLVTKGSTVRRLRGKKRLAALEGKKWMSAFIALAMEPQAVRCRREIEVFGNRKHSESYNKCWNVIRLAMTVKWEVPNDLDAHSIKEWKMDSRVELGEWLADKICNNGASELEALTEVMRNHFDLSSRSKSKQTLKACILRCLTEHIHNAGLKTNSFNLMIVATALIFDWMELDDSSKMPNHLRVEGLLAAWWEEWPLLLPHHLPTKKKLRELTETAYTDKILDQFPRDFRAACKDLGLSGLESG